MLFTEQFNIARKASDSWFDPILDHDTKLFIDPFLVFKVKEGRFAKAHDKIVEFFNYVFELIAQSGGDKNSTHYRKALNILLFPEVREICLGYASSSTKGAGSGFGFSSVIASAIWTSIKAGVKKIEHFEELSIFNEGIGADRISDMTANILKDDFISYTQEISNNYNIPLTEQRVRNSSFDFDNKVWLTEKVLLPVNPSTNNPVILVPLNFIRPLPVINPEDFWDYVCSHENQMLRDNLSYHIKGKVRKKDIVSLARTHLDIVQKYVKSKEEREAKPYDLDKDTENYYRWYKVGKELAEKNPLKVKPPANKTELLTVVNKIIEQFKHFIEFQKGYELLWTDGRPRGEEVVQRLFMGIALAYCKANDIDPSKEENLGSGPVDFKFSRGFSERVIIELKLAKNTKFWNGLTIQTPQYLKTEKIKDGIFLVISYSRRDLRRINGISEIVNKVNKENSTKIRVIVVDASIKPSASKMSKKPYSFKIELPEVDLKDIFNN